MSGPENTFRKGFCDALQGLFREHVYIQKNHGSSFSAGLPDLELVVYGNVGWYELKATKESRFNFASFTALQMHTMKRIYLAGGRVCGLVLWGAAKRVTTVPWPVIEGLRGNGMVALADMSAFADVRIADVQAVKSSRAGVWDLLGMPGSCPFP